jgi:hypothetical protein
MEKTIRLALLLLIVTGLIFTACSSDEKELEEAVDDRFEEVEEVEDTDIGQETQEEPEEEDDRPTPSVRTESNPGSSAVTPVEDVEEEVVEVAELEVPVPDSDVVEMVVEEVVEPETTYIDGTYSATGSYSHPDGSSVLTVSITVEDDVITGVTSSTSSSGTTRLYQDKFADGIASKVAGISLEDLDGVSFVNGSSLTGNGFNIALASIKTQALR